MQYRPFQPLFGTLILTALLVGCKDGSGPVPSSGPNLVASRDTTLGDAVLGSLTVQSGTEVTITGTRVEVQGDLTIESGATIHGTQDRLVLIVKGDLTHNGTVTSEGHLVIASDESRVPTAAQLEAVRESSSFEVIDRSGSPPTILPAWMITGGMSAGTASPAASPAPAVGQQAPAPARSGGTVFIALFGNLTVQPPPGAPGPLALAVPNGANGFTVTGCNVTAQDGGRGGNLEFEVSGGILQLSSVVITGGNGGKGGDANSAAPCPTGSVNTAGKGGQPGWIRMGVERFGFGGGFEFNSVGINGWDGGDGGLATITGANGGAPGAAGASVTARGGKVETLRRYLFVSTSIQVGPGGAILSVLNGGDGGDATATGGNGAAGVCNMNTSIASPSGNGGDGTARGGDGGTVQVAYSVPATFAFGVSFFAGDGGDATAVGGSGANGVPCHIQGGDGGDGGIADANPGARGTSAFPGGPGVPGAGSATGGNGSPGGDAFEGFPPAPPVTQGGNGGNGGHAFIGPAFGGTGGNGGKGGDAGDNGGNGGDAGCPGGSFGLKGFGLVPGQDGNPCP